ncbi:hypothetical protein BJ508DRAFT_321453 [Ascobolus immersus RN42]|uniref:EGF-like domain-containing protein n=1 Tax=Ascobolus immersus RN42 TaxID=1160509 RepID=A0A3N4IL65_ASCIM|nr:hypothetical protein BJ508DRAFT_321453 [Ascobolus immersus RN42]
MASRGGYGMDQGYSRGRGVIPPIPEEDREERGYNRSPQYNRPEDNPNWPLPAEPLPSLIPQPPRVRGDYGMPPVRPFPAMQNSGPGPLYPQAAPAPRQLRPEQPQQFQQQFQQREPQRSPANFNYNPPANVGRPVLVSMPRRNQSVDVTVENTYSSPHLGFPNAHTSTLSPTPSDFPFPDNLASPNPPVPAMTKGRGDIPSSIYSAQASPMLPPQRPGSSSRASVSSYASSNVIPSAWAPVRDGRGNTDSFGVPRNGPVPFNPRDTGLNFDTRDTQYTDAYAPPSQSDTEGSDSRIGYAVSTDFGAPGRAPAPTQGDAGYGYFLKPETVSRQIGSEIYLMPSAARDSQLTVSSSGEQSNDRKLVYSMTPSPGPGGDDDLNEDPITTKLKARGQFSRKAPAGLDIGKVKDAEARGSLTSLPDLIRRATKLATALDTGTRPGSRLGRASIDDFKVMMSDSSSKRPRKSSFMMLQINEDEKEGGPAHGTRSSSASGWPTFPSEGPTMPTSPQKKPRRRICGLPAWAFWLLLILGIIVVAAAIVVPIQLVTLARKSDEKATAQPSTNNTTLAVKCRRTNPCQNGGINVADSNFCGCVCTDGFTGSQCQLAPQPECGTFSSFAPRGGIQNATVGTALPKYMKLGLQSFDFGLDPAMLLAVFNSQNVSCSTQNYLITFMGSDGTTPAATAPAITNEDGLIVADPSAPTVPISQTVLEFARVAVLRYAQELRVENVTTIHDALEGNFRGGKDFGEIVFGGGNSVQLDSRLITINGTVLGDGSAAAGTPATTPLEIELPKELKAPQ